MWYYFFFLSSYFRERELDCFHGPLSLNGVYEIPWLPCQARLCYLFCLEMSFAACASASFLDNTTLHSELCRGAISEVEPYYAFKLPRCGIDKGCNIGNGECLQQPRLLWHIFLVDLVTIPNNMVWYTNCNIWYQFF